ncbi:MAG TPA: hypothetical protein VIJ31_00410 [Acidothermaceae bacterium]
MTDDESRAAGQYGGPYGGPANPWAAPGSPGGGPFASPEYPPAPRRSRTLIWVSVVVVIVVLAASSVGALVLDTHHHSGPSAAAVAPAASSAPASAGSSVPQSSPSTQSPSPSSPSPSSSPSFSPSAAPSTGQPTAPAGGAAPGSASGPLDQYLLAPAEVGASSMMFLIDGGRNTTNQATLDWCNFTYTSEALRMTRVQVEYTGNAALPAGNEFVHYQKGGTARAWAELQKAVTTCPPSSTTDGYVNDQVQRAGADSELVARQIILSYHVTDPTGQLNLPWQAVVYQFDGDYFSGIYVYGLSRSLALTEAEQLAAKSATHLAQASRGKPGTGGGPIQSVASAPPDTGVQD